MSKTTPPTPATPDDRTGMPADTPDNSATVADGAAQIVQPEEPGGEELGGEEPGGEELGGPAGPEPTRFGDWEQRGRCSDF